MWYWYELICIGLITDLLLSTVFKKYVDKVSKLLKNYVEKKLRGNC